jgi:hypothetical protein
MSRQITKSPIFSIETSWQTTTNINSIFHKQSVINFSQHLRQSSSLILLPHNLLQSRDPNLTSSKQRSQHNLLLNISQLRVNSCMETEEQSLSKFRSGVIPTNFSGLDPTSHATTTFSHLSGCPQNTHLQAQGVRNAINYLRRVARQSAPNIGTDLSRYKSIEPKNLRDFRHQQHKIPVQNHLQIKAFLLNG